MRKGVWSAVVGVAFAVGVVTGILWQAYRPLLGTEGVKAHGRQSQDVATLVGTLKGAVQGTGDVDVYYEQRFAAPPALTFTREGDVRLFSFHVVEQRADGFKIHISAISTDVFPRWEAKGQLASK